MIALSLVLPGVASANTASVKCDSTGVVFTYNADFGRSKVSTEIVNGVSYEYTVPVHGRHAHLAGRHRRHLRQRVVERRVDPEDQAALPEAAPAASAASAAAAAAARRRRLRRLRAVTTPPPAPPAPPAQPVAPPVVPATPVVPSTPSTPPKITLRKKALATTVPAGSTVRYQLVVKATGGTAHDVVVCDKLPRPHDVRLARHRDAAERQGLLGGR